MYNRKIKDICSEGLVVESIKKCTFYHMTCLMIQKHDNSGNKSHTELCSQACELSQYLSFSMTASQYFLAADSGDYHRSSLKNSQGNIFSVKGGRKVLMTSLVLDILFMKGSYKYIHRLGKRKHCVALYGSRLWRDMCVCGCLRYTRVIDPFACQTLTLDKHKSARL